jgi:hypothetical protein
MMLAMKWIPLILLTLSSTTAMAEGDRDPRRAIRGAVIQGEDGTVVGSYICRNTHIFEGVSFVGCGAASDLFSVTPQSAELSHYRLEHTVHVLQGPLELRMSFGGGMAEGQLGQDAPGFFLNPDASRQTVEAAGPEAVVAIDLWWPTDFENSDFRLRLDAGMTWLPGWQAVGGTSNDFVPFGVLTVNAEF